MVKATKSSIDIFLRCRPVALPSGSVEVDAADSRALFNVPRDSAHGCAPC